jgi:hypothetical protein
MVDGSAAQIREPGTYLGTRSDARNETDSKLLWILNLPKSLHNDPVAKRYATLEMCSTTKIQQYNSARSDSSIL